MSKGSQSIRHLGVLLCYNDGDILEEVLQYYLNQCDAVIVYNHGSTDNTAQVLERYRRHLVDSVFIPREFDFYSVYPFVSTDLMHRWVKTCHWISWPDQDEFLEGPKRDLSYRKWVDNLIESDSDWVEFNNFNYWFTDKDDMDLTEVTRRIRHYNLFPDCAPRIRAWRAKRTNLRVFNHNQLAGKKESLKGNLRHYPARSLTQITNRMQKSRKGISKGSSNVHYRNMSRRKGKLIISSKDLHYDDGFTELKTEQKLNWRDLYGYHAGYINLSSTKHFRWLRKYTRFTAKVLGTVAEELQNWE